MRVPRGVVGEVGVLAGLLVLLVAGSVAAQQRQVPPAVPLDVVGVVLLVGAVAVLPGRGRWPRTVFAAVTMIIDVWLWMLALGVVMWRRAVAHQGCRTIIGRQ